MKRIKYTFTESYIDYRVGTLEIIVPNDIEENVLDDVKSYFESNGGDIRRSNFKHRFPLIELVECRSFESVDSSFNDSNIETEEEDIADTDNKKDHLPEWL